MIAGLLSVVLILPTMITQQTALNKLKTEYKSTPYVWGGSGLNGIDCSGFVQLYLGQVGMDPVGDQTAQSLHDYAKLNWLAIQPAAAKLGDIVFFKSKSGADPKGMWGGRLIRHVGIVAAKGEMLDASARGKGVGLSSVNRSGYVSIYYRPGL